MSGTFNPYAVAGMGADTLRSAGNCRRCGSALKWRSEATGEPIRFCESCNAVSLPPGPPDPIAELTHKLEADKAERERQREAAREREERRAAAEAEGKRLHGAFEAVYTWPAVAIKQGQKPSPQFFQAWADRWIEAGLELAICHGAREKLQNAKDSGVPELGYVSHLLLSSMEQGRLRLATMLGTVYTHPVARKCFRWLPYVGHAVWSKAGACFTVPDGVTALEMHRAEAAFGWTEPGVVTPAGWEGSPPWKPIRDLRGFVEWVQERLEILRYARKQSIGGEADNPVRHVRNAHLLLESLSVPGRPTWKPGERNTDQVDSELGELLAWAETQLAKSPSPEAGAGSPPSMSEIALRAIAQVQRTAMGVQESAAPEAGGEEAGAAPPAAHATPESTMQQLAAALGGDTAGKILVIAQDSAKTVDQRQRLIAALDNGAFAWDSVRWEQLLGCSSQMARKTDWWRRVRAERLRERN